MEVTALPINPLLKQPINSFFSPKLATKHVLSKTPSAAATTTTTFSSRNHGTKHAPAAVVVSTRRNPNKNNDVWVSRENNSAAKRESSARKITKHDSITTNHDGVVVGGGGGGETDSVSTTARHFRILDVLDASDFSSALQRSGRYLRVQGLNLIMRHLGKLNRLDDLSQLFSWMQQNGKINFASYSSYIKLMGKSLDPVKALEMYNCISDESTRTNVSVCNSVLSCLIKNGKYESSFQLFHQMKQDGLVPDIVTYSTLLAGCAKVEDGYSKALGLIQELKMNGLRIDAVTYGTIMHVCASKSLCKEAESYFIEMKNEGHVPNLYHYSSLLNAYSLGGDYEKAHKLLVEMKSAGLAPNKVILTTLLKVYTRGGLFEKSRELLKDLEASGFAEEEMPYCLLMDGLAKAGRLTEARLIFEEMKKKGVKTDGYSHSIMITAFCRGGFLEEAKQLAYEYETKYEKYDVFILNAMLCSYCKAGEMENVMKTMKKMDALAIKPDSETFKILIKYFCKEKLFMLAYQTLQDMHKKGHQPEEELCSFLMYFLGKSDHHSEAFSVYNMLRYSKRTMCKDLHEKILHVLIAGQLYKDAYVVVKDHAKSISHPAIKKFASSFMNSGNINLINDVVKTLHISGFKIDQDLFTMAISRYIAQPEKKELLLRLLEWMPGQGYVVDPSTRNLILKNSHLLGRQLTAEVLSKQHTVSKAARSRDVKEK